MLPPPPYGGEENTGDSEAHCPRLKLRVPEKEGRVENTGKAASHACSDARGMVNKELVAMERSVRLTVEPNGQEETHYKYHQ